MPPSPHYQLRLGFSVPTAEPRSGLGSAGLDCWGIARGQTELEIPVCGGPWARQGLGAPSQGVLVAHQQPAAGARERLFSSPGGSRRSAAGSPSLLSSQIFGTDSAWQLRRFDSAAKHRQRHGPSFSTITRSSGKRGDKGRVWR